ncbi:MaoC family dehydratase N-terminal domain-containing protein [Pseudomonas sp. BGr12]|uniref:FAS1-like dehydratase domain-containing protein n=1 Tax=Pseudomonas sp. BGr12 TaxID=2936269 RepID=UPI0025594E54|nr:MaoC family dehydratase N-terminal domain-containing protein [Pseudomonas sp. BJa5]MDL2428448.1 MaoC family dehydratase N-terminal domain-containing protein [Pseudomonas sp. BJa5]
MSVRLDEWIGKSERTTEFLSLAHLQRVSATLGEPVLAANDSIPHLWQWCFFQPALSAGELGRDGHPALGGFLPPADNRNRMWAGGRLSFIKPLKADSFAERTSTITAIKEKDGSTGNLLFVTVSHVYEQFGEVCIREEQDIVYREPSVPKAASEPGMNAPEWSEEHDPSTTQLFRYSAVTFNGHRIHYDFNYATEVEGYAGLVTHGPLIATLNLSAFIRANPDKEVTEFSYRGVRPLTCGQAFQTIGRITEDGHAQLEAANSSGVAQVAKIKYVSKHH